MQLRCINGVFPSVFMFVCRSFEQLSYLSPNLIFMYFEQVLYTEPYDVNFSHMCTLMILLYETALQLALIFDLDRF